MLICIHIIRDAAAFHRPQIAAEVEHLASQTLLGKTCVKSVYCATPKCTENPAQNDSKIVTKGATFQSAHVVWHRMSIGLLESQVKSE